MKKTEIDMYNQSPFLIMRAAYLYYIKNQSQSEISKELNISVTTVSRLLTKARENDIIRFVIPSPYRECIQLGMKLKEKYRLKDAIVALPMSSGLADPDSTPAVEAKQAVALEGARYLQRIITPEDVLGVTWGTTVYEMINLLNPSQKVNATFVTLHGSIAFIENRLDVRTLVERMARAFFGENYSFLTDALMVSPEAADIMKMDRNNKSVIDMFHRITVAVFGIGSMYPNENSVLCSPEFMSEEDLQALRNAGCVGDIALRFFDRNGNECPTKLRDRMISIGFDQFKKIPLKIALVSGTEKSETIRAALKGSLIDVLIADYRLAEKLL